MPICASVFNRRIEIFRLELSAPNALNERVPVLVSVGKVWAGVNNRSAVERVRASRPEGSVSDVFTVRYTARTAAITAAYVIRYQGQDYNLSPPVEIGMREAFDILGEARAANEGL